jgi:hypothetical protein
MGMKNMFKETPVLRIHKRASSNDERRHNESEVVSLHII